MEKNTSILLQKQIRDNSEDLQREFLDMQAWEEQMKKKDVEVRHKKDDEKVNVLPPIRKKKKKSTLNTEESGTEKPRKAERIASSDYASWDRFDVTRACEEVEEDEPKKKKEKNEPGVESKPKEVKEGKEDKEKDPNKEENQESGKDIPKKKEKQESKILTEEELKKAHAEAIKFKDEGNELVQKQDYAKAVGKYTQAIRTFSGDAVFYANRALCQLKLDNLYSAESDCTEALKLNPKYVKAYHRRATARIELERYEDAKKDLEVILEMEPSNKEAICMLAQVERKLESKPEPLIIAGEEEKAKKASSSSIEKKIGEKLFAKSNTSKVDRDQSKTKEKGSKVIIEEIQNSPKSENSKMKSTDADTISKKKIKQNENEKEKTIQTKVVEGRNGLPSESKESKKVVEIIQKSKSSDELKNETEKKNINVKKSGSFEKKSTACEKSEKIVEKVETVPPPPKSSVAFLLNWRKNTSPTFRHNYLKQIKPNDLPSIFKESLESNVLSEILQILFAKFVPNKDPVYDFLHYLAQVKRFRALILFLTKADKDALTKLLEYCKVEEGKTDEEVKKIHVAYEL